MKNVEDKLLDLARKRVRIDNGDGWYEIYTENKEIKFFYKKQYGDILIEIQGVHYDPNIFDFNITEKYGNELFYILNKKIGRYLKRYKKRQREEAVKRLEKVL